VQSAGEQPLLRRLGPGAAVLGYLADLRGIGYVYHLCAFLPLIGMLTVFLPDIESPLRRAKARPR
jgi:FSR family fosmidomycin resistance protein-like MFS transporter